MPQSSWQKRFAIFRNFLYLYPALEPLPRTRKFWLALGAVVILLATFAVFYIVYLARMQDALMTPGEDVGIMDQAIWSFTHGHLFYQTICNTVSDANCYGLNGYSRLAIHFEPILFPISLLYFLWPSPKVLMIVQTFVVASGALPTFWLARLRLRSELAGVVAAALYLLYPALQQAEVGFFHAVVLTAAFLMFMLYCMYTRRTVWVFVFAVLALACKEEIPLVIFMLGLWSMVFQQRWRTGLGLIGLAVAWLGLTLLMFHLFSPLGQPLLASRYASLGSGPLAILKIFVLHPVTVLQQHLFEHAHLHYIRLLTAPANYFPLLAPWILVIAAPSLALNLLSSDPGQYQGTGQYNAEIVPILVFATIESFVLIIFLIQWLARWREERRAHVQLVNTANMSPLITHTAQRVGSKSGTSTRWLQQGALFVLLAITLVGVLRHDQLNGVMPGSQGFKWPQITAHDQLAQHFIAMIPPDASVSAQSSLVPHLSQRTHIYLFPYAVNSAEYIFLDVTSDHYPYATDDYQDVVDNLLLHGHYGLVASGDGYLLLKLGLPAPGLAPYSPAATGSDALPNLPAAFCSFTLGPPQAGTTPVQVRFTPPGNSGTLNLIGFQVNRPETSSLQITSYWQVSQGNIPALQLSTSLLNNAGQQVFASTDFTEANWCPSSTWQAGTIVRMSTSSLSLGELPAGPFHLTLALLPYGTTSATMGSGERGIPLEIVQAPSTVTVLHEQNFLQLQTFTLQAN